MFYVGREWFSTIVEAFITIELYERLNTMMISSQAESDGCMQNYPTMYRAYTKCNVPYHLYNEYEIMKCMQPCVLDMFTDVDKLWQKWTWFYTHLTSMLDVQSFYSCSQDVEWQQMLILAALEYSYDVKQFIRKYTLWFDHLSRDRCILHISHGDLIKSYNDEFNLIL